MNIAFSLIGTKEKIVGAEPAIIELEDNKKIYAVISVIKDGKASDIKKDLYKTVDTLLEKMEELEDDS